MDREKSAPVLAQFSTNSRRHPLWSPHQMLNPPRAVKRRSKRMLSTPLQHCFGTKPSRGFWPGEFFKKPTSDAGCTDAFEDSSTIEPSESEFLGVSLSHCTTTESLPELSSSPSPQVCHHQGMSVNRFVAVPDDKFVQIKIDCGTPDHVSPGQLSPTSEPAASTTLAAIEAFVTYLKVSEQIPSTKTALVDLPSDCVDNFSRLSRLVAVQTAMPVEVVSESLWSTIINALQEQPK